MNRPPQEATSTRAQTIVQYVGNPRAPEPVPLARARELGIHQVLDSRGDLAGDLPDPGLDRATVRKMYEHMFVVRAVDEAGWKLQRSGRIMFWIPNRGQEATGVAPTMAMKPEDWVFRAHRELGIWLVRGQPLSMMFAQFYGAECEPQRGRRLPMLLGSRAINLISSTTQVGPFITHAAGAGWAARLLGSSVNVLSFLGDGATSRGEFHSAMNFAGIHKPRVVFVCVNNSWAVTTPLSAQTATPDIASKGNAYGVRNLRVDGNDPLALYAVTKEAAERLEGEGPTLIEAVTYRLGFHTSSDNPDLYRLERECEMWAEWDPLKRLRGYLDRKHWWSDAEEEDLAKRTAGDIREAIREAEAMPLPDVASQFDDVFAESNWMLDEQKARILREIGQGAA